MLERPLDRRTFLVLAGAAAASCRSASSPSSSSSLLAEELQQLEGRGRLGVAVLDTGSGAISGHRLDERFAMCSTFKLVVAAMVLDRAAKGERALDARLLVGKDELLSHAPLTTAAIEAAFARGEQKAAIAIGELARAVQTTSDNTAANLLLRDLGGPAAVTAFCRAHGDEVTRLDRYEPEMNDVRGDDERDTTTPRAMAQLVARLLRDDLVPSSRATLREWMIATETGAARVRAGLPPDWIAGDKTGTGGGTDITAKCNDVVWIEPPGRAPLVVAAYFDSGVVAEWPSAEHEGVLAAVGRLIAGRR